MDEKTPITVFETAAFNHSATPPDDAMVAERVAVERWAGIDVGGRRKGFDLAVLDADSVVELRRSVRDPQAVRTTAGLERLGLAGTPARTNQDVRDAIAAAVTAREHGRGRSEAFGKIVVPLAGVPAYALTPGPVIA